MRQSTGSEALDLGGCLVDEGCELAQTRPGSTGRSAETLSLAPASCRGPARAARSQIAARSRPALTPDEPTLRQVVALGHASAGDVAPPGVSDPVGPRDVVADAAPRRHAHRSPGRRALHDQLRHPGGVLSALIDGDMEGTPGAEAQLPGGARVVRARITHAPVGPWAGVEGAHAEMWITPRRAQGPYPESLNFQPPGCDAPSRVPSA